MTAFEYKGYLASGAAQRGLIEAADVKEAREKLAARGVFSETVGPAGRGRRARRILDLEARSALYRELGALLRAGWPLSQALRELIEAPDPGGVRFLLAGVLDRIREGRSFAEALAQASRQVRSFERAAIDAGERAGDLGGALDRLADFLEEQESLRERVQTAMIYPALVLGLAVLTAVLMLGVMVPRFAGLLSEARIELPWITRALLSAGRLAGPLFLGALALLVLAAGWGRMRWRADLSFRLRCDRLLFRLYGIGSGYATLASLRFARTLSLLLAGGTDMVESLRLAGRAAGSPWVEALTEREAEALRHGRSLAECLGNIPPLGPSLAGWVQAGEKGGGLTDLLDHAARRQQQRWERQTTRALHLLEPALILFVGGLVLVLALALLAPVLALHRGML